MLPTVGRTVHFYTKDKSKHFNGQGEGPYAAVVTQTFGGMLAYLKVLPGFADPYDAGSVDFAPDDPVVRQVAGQFWVWPPRD